MKSFLQYLHENYGIPPDLGTYGDETGEYSVSDIIRQTTGGGGRTQRRKVKDLLGINADTQTKEGRLGDMVAAPNREFAARTAAADTRYPIHVTPQGWIVDGTHRLAKLAAAGERYANVKVVGDRTLRRVARKAETAADQLGGPPG